MSIAASAARLVGRVGLARGLPQHLVRNAVPAALFSQVRKLTTVSANTFHKYSHVPVRVSLSNVTRFSSAANAEKVTEKPDPCPLDVEAKANLARGNTREAWGLHEHAGAIGTPGLFSKYGAVPTALLALAALVSKEILILDEEIVIVSCFGALLFTSYTFLGDTIRGSLQSYSDEIKNEQLASFDAAIQQLEVAIQTCKEVTQIPTALKDLQAEYERISDAYCSTRGLVLQHQVMKFTESKLQDFANRESAMRVKFHRALVDKSTAFVEKRIREGDAKLKESLLNSAISLLEGKGAKVDPIRPLYAEYFKMVNDKILALYSKSRKLTPADKEKFAANVQANLNRAAAELGVDHYAPLTPVPDELTVKFRL